MNKRHYILCARLLALALVSIVTSPLLYAQTTVAGFTPGSFRVGETGAATYTIPIKVPPGTAGMEPKLSLVYSSQSANGRLGVGWSLNGLSVIHRCPRTKLQDGARGGVEHSWNDRYCLDGQRLVAITGGYGADSTEYRTERESFTRIKSFGTAGNGPAYFRVWTKSGQILEYGNATDSRIEAQGTATARVWALNKIADTKGNALTVTYTEDSTNGDFYPLRVDYTANAGTGASATRSVRFSYEVRPDVVQGWARESIIKIQNRLTNIKTYIDQTPVKDHRLAYVMGGASQRSRLASVTECAGDGLSCFPPTTFAWQDGVLAFAAAYSSQTGTDWASWPNARPVAGDFNGDGRTDIAIQYSRRDRGVSFEWQWNVRSGVLCANGHGLGQLDNIQANCRRL